MESLNDVWAEICSYLKSNVNEVVFNSWFNTLELKELRNNKAVLYIKTGFQKNILLDNYKNLLDDAFLEVMKFPVEIVIKTSEDMPAADEEKSPEIKNYAQYDYTFDTFIIGGSNRFAYAASMAVAENPGTAYNPLFIHGNAGLGKTHLLNAIATKIHEDQPEKVIVNANCETFVNEFYYNLQNNQMSEFRSKYRNIDVLLLDDIQFIAGKTSTEEEFFNTINYLYANQKQIVITSDRPPKDISSIGERLRSRFEQGLIADIQPPEFETRVGIIKRKAQLVNLKLPSEVIDLIAEQVKSNIRQLEGVVKKLHALSLINENITISTAQGVIKEIRTDNQLEPITVQKVVEEVSRTYSVPVDDIFGTKQDAAISYARQVSMYVVRKITQMPYKKIGEHFGKNHATVMFSCNKVTEKLEREPKENDIITDIMKNLQNN